MAGNALNPLTSDPQVHNALRIFFPEFLKAVGVGLQRRLSGEIPEPVSNQDIIAEQLNRLLRNYRNNV